MDTLKNMKDALEYIESNLSSDIDYAKMAQIALCSQYHFQRMFVFVVGVPLSEYIRRRRLTLAAFDLQKSNQKIIEIAVKYGYQSADSFSRAFQMVHGITPSKARQSGMRVKAYPRISFSLSLQGVHAMDYRIEKKATFTIAGIKKRMSHIENLGASVGNMWATTSEDTYKKIMELSNIGPIGLYGAYNGMYEDQTTDYYIATATTKECPEGFEKVEVTHNLWAVFEITGPLPQAMAEVWGRIFSEWFPTSGYEHAEAPEIEWYSQGDNQSENYKSEIWIPVIESK